MIVIVKFTPAYNGTEKVTIDLMLSMSTYLNMWNESWHKMIKLFCQLFSEQINPCGWQILRAHPKKLMGECGWNYMKELYPVAKHIVSSTFLR